MHGHSNKNLQIWDFFRFLLFLVPFLSPNDARMYEMTGTEGHSILFKDGVKCHGHIVTMADKGHFSVEY